MSTEQTPPEKSPFGKRLTRRRFLPGAAGVLALGAAGAAGFELAGNGSTNESTAASTTTTGSAPATVAAATPEAHSFVTRPDLRPPVIDIADLAPAAETETSPRFIALSPGDVQHNPDVQSGPLLVDRQGRIVWFKPLPGTSYDLQVQSYEGESVLTWWTGKIVSFHGVGAVTILNSSYDTVKTIAPSGHDVDLHDFVLTSRGTALMTSYEQVQVDLSSQGGPRDGTTWAGRVLEIDVATGKLVLDWNSLDHISVSESYKQYANAKGIYDYLHLNSVSELPDGNLLIAGRNTWAAYAVDRSTGDVLWRLGGKKSDFNLAPNAVFSWQHHVRAPGPSLMTVFDNGMNTTDYSRALLLSYDLGTHQVKLVREFLHPARFTAVTLGSVQAMPNGNVFVGWGIQPYFAEYNSNGTMLSDGEFPVGIRSYRAFLVDWVGRPTDKPAVAARANPAGGFAVYASWNGATEIATWTVLAGQDGNSLRPVGSQPWSGFETTIIVNSTGPAFQVVAEDSNGKELGRSEIT